jgi:hypothetical protein
VEDSVKQALARKPAMNKGIFTRQPSASATIFVSHR